MNDGQRAHVEARLRAGASHAEMVQYLRSEGVDEVTAAASVAEVAASLQPASNNGLPTVGDLLRASWQFVTSRTDLVGWYVVVSLVPVVVIAILGILAIAAAELAPVAMGGVTLLGLIFFAALIWFTVTASAGLIYAVAQSDGEAIRFRAGWDWARSRFWQIAILGLVTSLVLLTSALALLIPALIVFMYVVFYFLEFIRHEHRNFHALAASTHIVYGRFWPIAIRLGAMMLIIAAANFVLTVMFGLNQENATTISIIGEIIAMVVSFFLTVMFMRYLALLHAAATATASPYLHEPLSRSYKLYKIVAWIGGGLMVLFVLGSLLALLGFAA